MSTAKGSKITPFFMLSNAEEAFKYYVSIFRGSKVISENKMGGKFVTGIFEWEGQRFFILNSGPANPVPSTSVSFLIDCENQEDVDYYWQKFSENGGEEMDCGWVKDKYGFFWQVVPTIFGELLNSSNPEVVQKVFGAMQTMKKFDIAQLKAAAGRN
eukprot:TRINITY_DN2226_c0_g1_i1.p1 TRINITY_DN2226_c0_g1~~TRINITY_DN2226_c0_g1_i1.p1  ORF type:complete len:157 (+),score=46.40 TRINITY_DN2226_c0_g1_i1:81-551(+)